MQPPLNGNQVQNNKDVIPVYGKGSPSCIFNGHIFRGCQKRCVHILRKQKTIKIMQVGTIWSTSYDCRSQT